MYTLLNEKGKEGKNDGREGGRKVEREGKLDRTRVLPDSRFPQLLFYMIPSHHNCHTSRKIYFILITASLALSLCSLLYPPH